MSRGPSTFKKRDIAAAVEAVKTAGCEVNRVEIDRAGRIVIVVGKPDGPCAEPEQLDEWDARIRENLVKEMKTR